MMHDATCSCFINLCYNSLSGVQLRISFKHIRRTYKICSKAFFSYTNNLQLPNKCFQIPSRRSCCSSLPLLRLRTHCKENLLPWALRKKHPWKLNPTRQTRIVCKLEIRDSQCLLLVQILCLWALRSKLKICKQQAETNNYHPRYVSNINWQEINLTHVFYDPNS